MWVNREVNGVYRIVWTCHASQIHIWWNNRSASTHSSHQQTNGSFKRHGGSIDTLHAATTPIHPHTFRTDKRSK